MAETRKLVHSLSPGFEPEHIKSKQHAIDQNGNKKKTGVRKYTGPSTAPSVVDTTNDSDT